MTPEQAAARICERARLSPNGKYAAEFAAIIREAIETATTGQPVAIAQAWEHVSELRDAWQRGSIREIDRDDGLRSNRNAEVEIALRKFVAAKARGE